MVGPASSQAFLRQIAPENAAPPDSRYPGQPGETIDRWHLLSCSEEVHIGRDPRCAIVVEASQHRAVSRHHAVVRPVASTWELCDLNSANGTYLNGDRLWGCRMLGRGDRIQLGQSGPVFVFEYRESTDVGPGRLTERLTGHVGTRSVTPPPQPVTFTQLFPILSTGQDLAHKAYLIPGSVTVLVVVSLFLTVGEPQQFNPLLASYLGAAGYYFVYRLCGKHKPWWLLVGTAAFTFALLNSPLLTLFIWFFRGVLPGQLPQPHETLGPLALFGRMFLGAGLMEELIKAIPVLGVLLLGRFVSPRWQSQVGIREPLDGILLGAASAVGFTLLETLGQYVPNVTHVNALEVGLSNAQLAGLQLLIPRLLGSIAGHMAYSGYLGYFIGLSVLVPHHRWRILIVGYGTAALLHALWNVMGSYSAFLLVLVGVLSYAFLVAAILKARALSPTRAQNFATRFSQDPP